MNEEPIATVGILPWSRKIAGSYCLYRPSIFNITKVQHLSRRIIIPDHSHQALKISRSCWVFLTLLEIIAASSANWSQKHWNKDFFGPQIVPSLFNSGLFSVSINVLKQRLKKRGEQGSPCKIPLFTGMFFVLLLPMETDVDASLYMLLKSWTNESGTWWKASAVLIRLWLTSPKAFFRSRRVTTNPLECFFESRMMCVSISVCSVTPSCFGQNPFCFFLSKYSLESRNEYSLFFVSDARILYQTACKVIGRKFPGFKVSPFLKIKIVTICFQHSGIRLDRQHSPMIRCKIVLAIGHFCRMRFESWSTGPAGAPRLALRMRLATSL